MTYYHPAWESLHRHHLRHGFLSRASLNQLEKGYARHRHLDDKECRTLVCTSYDAALEYGRGLFGSTDLVIIEIEGDYETTSISGTMVPEGTCFLYGEIPPDRVRLAELETAPSVSVASGPKF
jgi:hypothetical protein